MSKISDLVKQPTGVYNGHNIQSATVDQTLRPNLNFSGFNISDDPTNGRTNVALPTGSTGLPTVAFSAKQNVQQTITPSGTNQNFKVNFNVKEFDTNNNYDTSLSRFTPTVAGKYLITSNVHVATTATDEYFIVLYKNGAEFKIGDQRNFTSGYWTTGGIQHIVDMNGTSDYIEIFIKRSANSSYVIDLNNGNTYFQASLLSTNVTHAGYLLSPNVGFSAHNNNVPQALVTSAWRKITFSAEEYDANSNYNTSTSVFTPTVAGRYQVNAAIRFDTVTSTQSISIYKNGSIFKEIDNNQAAGDNSLTISCTIDMNGTTDYLEVYGLHYKGTNLNVKGGISDTYFQASLIAATAVYAKNMLTPNVGFSATKSVDQTGILNSIETKITFPIEEFDTNNNYDPTTSKFTPTISGKYLVTASVSFSFSNSNAAQRTNIYKNGALVKSSWGSHAGDWNSSECTAIIDMNGTTDYLEVYASQNSGSTQSVFGSYPQNNFFQAQLLSATTAYSGYNMAPSVSFSANRSTAQSGFASNVPTKVIYDIEEFDTNNNYDTSSGRFIPTVAGKYLITASAGVEAGYSGTNIAVLSIVKNGTTSKTGDYRQFSTDYFGADATCIVDMNGTTDYLEVTFLQRTGSSVSVGATSHTYFQGSLLSTSTDIGTLVKENSQLVSGNNVILSHYNTALRTLTASGVKDTDVLEAFTVPVNGMYLVRFSAAYIGTTQNTHFDMFLNIDGVQVAMSTADVYTSNERPNISAERMIYLTKGSHVAKLQFNIDYGTFTYGFTNIIIQNPNNQYNVLALPDYKNNSRLVKEIVLSTAGTTMTFDGLDGLADGGYELDFMFTTSAAATVNMYVNGDATPTNYYVRKTGFLATPTNTQPNTSEFTASYGAYQNLCKAHINISNGKVLILSNTTHFSDALTGPSGTQHNVRYNTDVSNITTLSIVGSGNLSVGSTARLYRKGTAQSEPQKVIYTGVPTAGSLVKEIKVTNSVQDIVFSGLDIITDGGYILEGSIVSDVDGYIRLYKNTNKTNSNYRVTGSKTIFTTTQNYYDGVNNAFGTIDGGSKADFKVDICPPINSVGTEFAYGVFTGHHTDGNQEIITARISEAGGTSGTGNPSSITISHSAGANITAGSTFRLYRKVPQVVYPPSVITTEKVYEKTITLSSAMSSVTFDGLDIIADGGYEIVANVVGSIADDFNIQINNDTTAGGYLGETTSAFGTTAPVTTSSSWAIGRMYTANATANRINVHFANGNTNIESTYRFYNGTNEYLRFCGIRYTPVVTNVNTIKFVTNSTYTFSVGSTFTIRGKKARTDVIAIPSLTNIVDQKVITSPTSIVSFPNLNILRDGRYRLEAEIYNNSGADIAFAPMINGDYLKTNYNRNYYGTSAGTDNLPVVGGCTNNYTSKMSVTIDICNGIITARGKLNSSASATTFSAYDQTMKYVNTVTNLTQLDLVCRDSSFTNSASGICAGSKITLYKDSYDVPATSPYDVVSAGKLTDLVKEIVLQSPSSQVDFDGLDINRDGEYELSYQIIGGTSQGLISLVINNDTTTNNYDATYIGQSNVFSGGAAPFGNAAQNTGPAAITVGIAREAHGTAKIKIENGKVFIKTDMSQYTTSDSKYQDTIHQLIYRPTGGVQNLTKFSFIATNPIAAGSTFRLYRKKANNVLALTSRYLNNLVEEKVLTMDSSSVTFTGLDSLVDGDYYLEYIALAGNTTASGVVLSINGDTTSGRYLQQGLTGGTGTSIGSVLDVSTSIDLGYLPSNAGTNGLSGTLLLKRMAGFTSFYSNQVQIRATSAPLLQTTGGSYTQDVPITSLNIVTSGLIKAGSKFTLYKSNGAKKLVPYDPTDISSRTSDYPLRPGEVVYLNYSAVTTLPLCVATEEGEYEVIIKGDTSISPTNNNGVAILPNNATQAGALDFSCIYVIYGKDDASASVTPLSWKNGATYNAFGVGSGTIIHSSCKVSTTTVCKNVRSSNSAIYTTSQRYQEDSQIYWSDTTTPWTSLGTITFPFAQSGKIIIKRII
jgi:hypothetical protein